MSRLGPLACYRPVAAAGRRAGGSRPTNGLRHAGRATVSCRAISSRRTTPFQPTWARIRLCAWRARSGAPGISIQSRNITGGTVPGTISAGPAFTAAATMAAPSAPLDADADRADLELRLIKLLLEAALRAHPFAGSGVSWHVRCSANRSGDPIVAEKRPDYHAINYPELQARIEIAHRPLIEVNDAARR